MNMFLLKHQGLSFTHIIAYIYCKEAVRLESTPPTLDFEREDSPEVASLLVEINRGGLLFSQDNIFTLGVLCCRVFFEIKENETFINCQHQRELFCDIMDIVFGEHYDIFWKNSFLKGS